jgi:pimeloyl-ACP methyl ester carboxylesterase
MRRLPAAGAVLVLAALAGCASPEPPPADTGGPKIGVVVLHQEGGDPYGRTLRFTRTMQREGLLTDSPEMPWSARRAYDAGVDAMLKEIDASVARLKSRGAKRIIVAGHGLGAAAALRYARLRRVDGMIALAPGDAPGGPQKAKAAEYSGPKGAMSLHGNAASLRAGTPVLWVVGDTEAPTARKADQAAFDALPRNPPPKLVEVAAGQLDTPDAAAKACAGWIREVAGP